MTYAVQYSSITGNTRRVAEAIRQALPEKGCAAYGEIGDAVPQAPLIFVGFWTDKGTCDEAVRTFLSRLSGKKVALFGTAGFGGSAEYFQGILSRAAACLPHDACLVDSFMCQGRMPDSVKKRYEAMRERQPDDSRVQAFLENFEAARSHPDPRDLEEAAAFAVKVMEALKETEV